MIEEIFEMIMKESRSRKGLSLDLHMLIVLFEVIDKVCDAWKTIKVEDIKKTRLKFRRKDL